MKAKETLDQAIEQLTQLRIEMQKQGVTDLDDKASDLNLLLCKAHDQCDLADVVKRIENYAPEPVELPEFDLSKKGSHVYCIEWGELKARKNEYEVYQKLLNELR